MKDQAVYSISKLSNWSLLAVCFDRHSLSLDKPGSFNGVALEAGNPLSALELNERTWRVKLPLASLIKEPLSIETWLQPAGASGDFNLQQTLMSLQASLKCPQRGSRHIQENRHCIYIMVPEPTVFSLH